MDYSEIAKQYFMGGIHLLQANNLEGAEAQFARALEILPERVSTLNNLAGVKLRLGKFAEAEGFARKAIGLEAKSPEAWGNLGLALAKTGKPEVALQAYAQALQADGAFVGGWLAKAELLVELERYGEALQACERALALVPEQPEVLRVQSLALKGAGQLAAARAAYTKALALRVAQSPVHEMPRRGTQQADILIIHPDPCLDDEMKSFAGLHEECPNYPGQLARLLHDQFHFSFVFKGDFISPETRERIPTPDFVINNCVNAEQLLADGCVPELSKAVDGFGAPVVNHPVRAALTGREATARALANLPGIRVPRTLRFAAKGKSGDELVAEIEAHFIYPIITRQVTSQQGFGMTKVDSREALVRAVLAGLPEQFFVTEFVDSRGGSPFYRKLRAAIVQDEIVIVRVDYDHNWKIYARKSDDRVAFYRQHPQLLECERRICANPEKELGPTMMAALRAIRSRITLEVFGVDFDVDAHGALVFYEANATMNLFSTARDEIPYPKEPEERLRQACSCFLMSLGGLK